MVAIHKTEDQFIFEVQGIHKLWTFNNTIKVSKENVVNAFQSDEEFTLWKGWRMPGTSIPWVINAGTYYKKGKCNFWDVTNKKNTIVVDLQNSPYNRLIIDVENPLEAINLLNSK